MPAHGTTQPVLNNPTTTVATPTSVTTHPGTNRTYERGASAPTARTKGLASTSGNPGGAGSSAWSTEPAGRRPRTAQSTWAAAVIDSLARAEGWSAWASLEPRLTGFASLDEAVEAWRGRDPRCYRVVAGLAALGSRRGGDDDDAALAAVVLLEDGVTRVATTLRDLCEIDDVRTSVWEEVKAAEPQLGPCAARYLLQRARQRLCRPSAGMVSRIRTTSLDQQLDATHARSAGTHSGGAAGRSVDRDPFVAAPEVDDPLADLADLLTWATGTGVIGTDEVDLIIELLAAENDGLAREQAQRLVGERRGVTLRTIRRRRDATTARLRASAPDYLSAIA